MEQKENKKKGFRLINLSRKSIVFLVGMLLVVGVMYITLPFELTVAGVIVIGVIIAYESLRAIIFWLGSLITACVRRFIKGVRRAIHVAKMPDDEFEACFSGKDKQEGESSPSDGEPDQAEASDISGQPQQDNTTETPVEPASASMLPAHAQIHPLTPIQAAAKAMHWWTYVGLDGLDGKERLSMLIERLKDETPDEKSYNLVEHSKELCLPQDFSILQAVAQLLSEQGYEADAEEDTTSLYVMEPESAGKNEIESNTDAGTSKVRQPENSQETQEVLQGDDHSTETPVSESGKLQLLLVQPGKSPEVLTTANTNEELEKLLGSPSEAIHPFDVDTQGFLGRGGSAPEPLCYYYHGRPTLDHWCIPNHRLEQ